LIILQKETRRRRVVGTKRNTGQKIFRRPPAKPRMSRVTKYVLMQLSAARFVLRTGAISTRTGSQPAT
jgi:hypothetical protein